MPLNIGSRLGSYEVVAAIGAGGMGEVYRALDTNLKREVAIKVLPENLSSDTDGLARLQREAHLLAAVNHPNIASIYNLEEAAGTRFLVLELIDGVSLEHILTEPLIIDDALELCRQVAEALEAAHKAGIVHRDLKPANIMVTSEGRVKVLDFGLAKAVEASGPGESAKLVKITGTGMIVGTPPYMSPEQVRAQPLDHGADVWAFGCVAYEMLSGKRAFDRATVGDILTAILEHDPDWTALPSDAPPAVVSLVQRCLLKDRQERQPNLSDVSDELREILASSPDTASAVTQAARSRPVTHFGYAGAMIGFLAATVVIAIVVSKFFEPVDSSLMSAPTHRQITFAGDAREAALSPHGASIAYVIGKRGDRQRLMLADLSGGQAIEILDGSRVSLPEWSPDGSSITVSAAREEDGRARVYRVPRLGGSPRELGYGYYTTWSPDGSMIAFSLYTPPGFWVTSQSTGESDFTTLDGYDFNTGLSWSPTGERVAVLTETTATGVFEIITVDPDGNNQTTTTTSTDRLSSPRWAPDGEAIYVLRHVGNLTDLLKVDVNSRGDARVEPTVVLSGLVSGDVFNVSADGRTLAYSTSHQFSNLWLAELTSEGSDPAPTLTQLTRGTSTIEHPAFSPDGDWIAYASQTSAGENLFKMPAEGGDPVQLTFSEDYQTSPAWSPDGVSIAFSSRDSDGASVWIMGADGSQPRRLYKTRVSTDMMKVVWSSGRRLLYQRPGNKNFSFLDVDTGEEQQLVPDEDRSWVFAPQYSPNGTQVALFRNRPPDKGIWLVTQQPYTERVVAEGALDPVGWSSDGRWIYVIQNHPLAGSVGRVPTSGGEFELLFTLPGDVRFASVDPTGTRIVAPVSAEQSDAFVVENFDHR